MQFLRLNPLRSQPKVEEREIPVAPAEPPQTEPPQTARKLEPQTARKLEPQPLRRPEPERSTDLIPHPSANALPSIDEIRRRRSEYFDSRGVPLQITGEVQGQSLRANLRLTLVLFLAAALGCGAGYWAYLQLPSATIALYVQAQPSALLVSWPPDQTRDCIFAALRINDEQELPLSLLQRDAGQAKIAATGDDVKIELIAQHWIRDSRGIVRYLRPVAGAAQQVPAANPETH